MKNFYVCPSTDPVDPKDENYEANLIKYAEVLERAGADALHADVMDGKFVERKTLTAPVLKKIRSGTTLPIDVHLMTNYCMKEVKDFISAGANIITLHIENFIKKNKLKKCKLKRAIKEIKKGDCLVGISLKPNTDEKFVLEIIKLVDLILVMSVEPGKSGQKFIENSYKRVESFDKTRKKCGLNYLIEVDGGITPEISKELKNLGADMVVSGSYIFKADLKEEAINAFKN